MGELGSKVTFEMNEPESTHVSFAPFSGIFNFAQNLALIVTTFCMVGLLPKAPGTWASLAAVGVYSLFADLIWQQQAQIIIVTMLIGVWCLYIVQKKSVHATTVVLSSMKSWGCGSASLHFRFSGIG
ncbi:MAG: phosphatidylglycerophosphatase A [Bdellovibrionota bacterium]